jgi:hypothetical protein
MPEVLSHYGGEQWRTLNKEFWTALLPYIQKMANGAEFYSEQSTMEWIVGSVRVGHTLASKALVEKAQHCWRKEV